MFAEAPEWVLKINNGFLKKMGDWLIFSVLYNSMFKFLIVAIS